MKSIYLTLLILLFSVSAFANGNRCSEALVSRISTYSPLINRSNFVNVAANLRLCIIYSSERVVRNPTSPCSAETFPRICDFCNAVDRLTVRMLRADNVIPQNLQDSTQENLFQMRGQLSTMCEYFISEPLNSPSVPERSSAVL